MHVCTSLHMKGQTSSESSLRVYHTEFPKLHQTTHRYGLLLARPLIVWYPYIWTERILLETYIIL